MIIVGPEEASEVRNRRRRHYIDSGDHSMGLRPRKN